MNLVRDLISTESQLAFVNLLLGNKGFNVDEYLEGLTADKVSRNNFSEI